MFDINVFNQSFDARLEALANAEKLTKDSLRDLSRELLQVTHATEDIGFINRTLEVLTPMNRKTATLFFQAFAGFLWSDETQRFYKKDKRKWVDITADVAAKLEDPHFNMWAWAEQNIELAPKPFKITEVTKFAERVLKKAKKEGIPQADILKAFFDGGFEADAIMAMMEHVKD